MWHADFLAWLKSMVQVPETREIRGHGRAIAPSP
jgi:hypothetical protein